MNMTNYAKVGIVDNPYDLIVAAGIQLMRVSKKEAKVDKWLQSQQEKYMLEIRTEQDKLEQLSEQERQELKSRAVYQLDDKTIDIGFDLIEMLNKIPTHYTYYVPCFKDEYEVLIWGENSQIVGRHRDLKANLDKVKNATNLNNLRYLYNWDSGELRDDDFYNKNIGSEAEKQESLRVINEFALTYEDILYLISFQNFANSGVI